MRLECALYPVLELVEGLENALFNEVGWSVIEDLMGSEVFGVSLVKTFSSDGPWLRAFGILQGLVQHSSECPLLFPSPRGCVVVYHRIIGIKVEEMVFEDSYEEKYEP